jgi:hypothetical protein
MWQQIVAGALVIAAAVYAARALGPRRWRRKAGAGATKTAGSCGCGKDEGGCH